MPTLHELLPCPFCASNNIDAEGWASSDRAGPACDDCAGTADTTELWNTRPLEAKKSIEVDIGAAVTALQASPDLAAMMNELVGGPALTEAHAEIDRLRAALKPFAGLQMGMVAIADAVRPVDLKDFDFIAGFRGPIQPEFRHYEAARAALDMDTAPSLIRADRDATDGEVK
jgi:hypothetical protein